LRAGPLSDKTVIQQLNDNFISTWVLNSTLSTLRDNGASADTRRLATAVLGARQKSSPVDCLVLTPDLAVVAVRPVHDLFDGPHDGDLSARYQAFLIGGLKKAKK
jgi:hypothetical protein